MKRKQYNYLQQLIIENRLDIVNNPHEFEKIEQKAEEKQFKSLLTTGTY